MAQELTTVAQWKEYFTKRLDASQFMALATTGQEGPWVCPVYFAFDERFNLFFLSAPSSLHMRNIEKNAAVACAVFDSRQGNLDEVVGVQIRGKAQFVTPEEAERAFNIYFTATPARKPSGPAHTPVAYTRPDAVWRLVRVVPQAAWVYSEQEFEGGREKVPQEVLQQ